MRDLEAMIPMASWHVTEGRRIVERQRAHTPAITARYVALFCDENARLALLPSSNGKERVQIHLDIIGKGRGNQGERRITQTPLDPGKHIPEPCNCASPIIPFQDLRGSRRTCSPMGVTELLCAAGVDLCAAKA